MAEVEVFVQRTSTGERMRMSLRAMILDALTDERCGTTEQQLGNLRDTMADLLVALVSHNALTVQDVDGLLHGISSWKVCKPSSSRYTSLDQDVDVLDGLEARILNRLGDAKVHTLRDLVSRPRAHVARIRGMGASSISKLTAALTERGLALGLTQDQVAFCDTYIDEIELSVHTSNVLHDLGCRHMIDVLCLNYARLKERTARHRRVWKELEDLCKVHELSMGLG